MLVLVTVILCSFIGHINSVVDQPCSEQSNESCNKLGNILWNEPSKESCNDLYSDYFNHLASITSYRNKINSNTEPINLGDTCKPVKLLHLQRHGTRTPGKKIINFVKVDLPQLHQQIKENIDKSNLCNKDDIKLWELDDENLNIVPGKQLTEEGEYELIALANRMKLRFPDLLNQPYDSKTYLFRFTNTSRTISSANNFAEGLFGRNHGILFNENNDPLAKIKDNKHTGTKYKDFITSHKDKLLNLSQRLGFDEPLKFDVLINIYTYCGFKTAWNKEKVSKWCTILNKSDFEFFEYSEDLKLYFKDGYGNKPSVEACTLLKDAIAYLDDEESKKEKNIFYFTHSGTILKMLSLLGLYNDDIIKNNDYSNIEKRKWRTSSIDPFASNISFVLYNCGNETKILILHQEKVIKLDDCEDICSYDTFKKIFNTELQNCNMQKND